MEKDPRRSITFLGISRSKRLFAVGLIVVAIMLFWYWDEGKGLQANRSQSSTTKLAVATKNDRSEGEVLAAETEIEESTAMFQVNIPSQFGDVVRVAELIVENRSLFEGIAEFQDEVVMNQALEVKQDLTVGGRLLLTGDAIGRGVDIDIEDGAITAGTVTASNLVYSVKAGSGISVSGTQDVTISATDLGSSQQIFKNIKVNSDTITAGSNNDTVTFKDGTGISLTRSGNEITVSGRDVSGWAKTGNYVALADTSNWVGIGTSTPTNNLEINSGTTGTSGVTFTQLTSASTVGVGGGKVLSVDSGGRIILVQDQTGDTPTAESVLPTAANGETLYFNGLNWVASSNLYHNGGQVGISTTPATNVRFHVLTNAANAVGAVIQRVTGQTANFMEFRNESGTPLSYVSADGVFHGNVSGDISGSINAGLSQGQVAFQGASALQGSNSLFWDSGNSRLGVGTNAPQKAVHIYNDSGLWVQNTSGGTALTSITGGSVNTLNSTTLSLGANANTAMTLMSSGNVGIGTTSPTSLFHVNGKTTGKALAILNETGNQDIFTASASGTSMFTIKNDGKVGIGTTAPTALLNLSSSTSDPTLIIDPGSSSTVDPTIALYDTTTSAGFKIRYDNDGGDSYIDSIFNGTDTAPAIRFRTETSAVTKEAMTITHGGSVGIGTTSPTSLLHLSSTSTSLTNGLFKMDWSPASATTLAGDLFNLNIGANGNATNVFSITDSGSTLFSVSESKITSAIPHEFTVAGDVSFGYDINLINQTAGNINSNGPFAINAGEVYENGTLTLRTYNKGRVVVDSEALLVNRAATISGKLVAGTTNPPVAIGQLYVSNAATYGKALAILNQTESADIFAASASGTNRFVITSAGRVGIGVAAPTNNLEVVGTSKISRDSNSYIEYNSSGEIQYYLSGFNKFKVTNTETYAEVLRAPTINMVNNGVTLAATGSVFTISNNSGGMTERLRITQSGSFGMGTNSPDARLSVNGDLSANSATISGTYAGNVALTINALTDADSTIRLRESGTTKWNLFNDGDNSDSLYITDAGGDQGVFLAQDATSWAAASDITLKENINLVDGSLDKIKQLRGVYYNFIGTQRTEVGLIAQEVQAVLPELVVTNNNGKLAVMYDRLAPVLVNAIQEQQGQLDKLGNFSTYEDRLAAVEAQNTEQDTVLAQLKTTLSDLFKNAVTFLADVTFKGYLKFSPDQTGYVAVPVGATEAKVTFKNKMPSEPIINLTPRRLVAGMKVGEVKDTHFIVQFEQPLAEELRIDWLATLKDTENSNEPTVEFVIPSPVPNLVVPEAAAAEPAASPTPAPSSTPVPTVAPSSSPEPVASESAATP
ncbi:MAG TPA: tail fiber domain-containing protein [Vitreimonas sp.]|nr:tail fiber domain-containing protein [Vitreimonas sp.]